MWHWARHKDSTTNSIAQPTYLTNFKKKRGGVSHYGLEIYIKKYIKAKEEL